MSLSISHHFQILASVFSSFHLIKNEELWQFHSIYWRTKRCSIQCLHIFPCKSLARYYNLHFDSDIVCRFEFPTGCHSENMEIFKFEIWLSLASKCNTTPMTHKIQSYDMIFFRSLKASNNPEICACRIANKPWIFLLVNKYAISIDDAPRTPRRGIASQYWYKINFGCNKHFPKCNFIETKRKSNVFNKFNAWKIGKKSRIKQQALSILVWFLW